MLLFQVVTDSSRILDENLCLLFSNVFAVDRHWFSVDGKPCLRYVCIFLFDVDGLF